MRRNERFLGELIIIILIFAFLSIGNAVSSGDVRERVSEEIARVQEASVQYAYEDAGDR